MSSISGGGIPFGIWTLRFPFGFGFDNFSRILVGCKALGIQMVETILCVGLH